MPTTNPIKTAVSAAILSLALSAAGAATASAGFIGPDTTLATAKSSIETVQYGYGYGYRRYRRPYGFYARRRFYNNHFGPGARKERSRTRLDYCKNQPSRC